MSRFISILTIFCVSLSGPAAEAETFSEGFTSTTWLDSLTATAVINLDQNRVHPPIQVSGWDEDGVAPFKNRTLSVGTGSDGRFERSRYASFDDGSDPNDTVIEINTDARASLNFTYFELELGWTIRPFGSRPLDIRSQSSMRIAGTIDCNGDNGHALLALDSTAVGRATGRCQGGNGGAGGSTVTAASRGVESGANTQGGGYAGPAIGDGGGGGGGYSQAATQATNGVAFGGGAGGSRGDNQQNDGFTIEGGGAGGGGGNYYNAGAVGIRTSGGGGGAGGGVIYLTAMGDITITATGIVRANGGAGGGTAGTGNGGGGGGGGGGSVAIMTIGSITLDGAVTAIGGAGAVTDGGDGGAGATGRTWLTDVDGVPGGGTIENPTSLLGVTGSVRYQTGAFTVASQLVDTSNSNPLFTGSSVTAVASGGSTVGLEAASADQSFTVAAATWFSSANIASASGGRYFRYRLTLNNADAVTPATASLVRIDYLRTTRDEYDFKAGCGSVNSGAGPAGTSRAAFALAMLFPLLLVISLRRRRVFETRVSYQR